MFGMSYVDLHSLARGVVRGSIVEGAFDFGRPVVDLEKETTKFQRDRITLIRIEEDQKIARDQKIVDLLTNISRVVEADEDGVIDGIRDLNEFSDLTKEAMPSVYAVLSHRRSVTRTSTAKGLMSVLVPKALNEIAEKIQERSARIYLHDRSSQKISIDDDGDVFFLGNIIRKESHAESAMNMAVKAMGNANERAEKAEKKLSKLKKSKKSKKN